MLWEKDNASKLPSTQVFKIRMILNLLDNAVNIKDVNFPESDIHPLKGDLESYWAVKINGNYRIIFKIENESVFDVDYIDYH